jgi:hypothetical protein
MTAISWAEFEAESRARGYDEVLQREWAADELLDTHTHPFAVSALMIAGDLWLTCDGQTRHLRAGDRFELRRDVPHAERYGPQGARFWAARRHAD